MSKNNFHIAIEIGASRLKVTLMEFAKGKSVIKKLEDCDISNIEKKLKSIISKYKQPN